MIRVHVPGATPPRVELPPGEAHHIGRVMRLHPGDEVVVFDGHGHEWVGRLSSVAHGGASVDLISDRVPVVEPPVAVTLGIGVLKGDQMDSVVRDTTMLGVSAVVPCVTEHVAVPDRARQARAVDRWTRVAIASAKQCERSIVPAIEPVRPLSDLLNQPGFDSVICCVEPRRGGGQSGLAPSRPSRALLLVGPEGGWSEDELARCRAADAFLLDLGPRTLRAEVAPTVALSVLWSHWGWR
jgi:16S rRNA (uracil1498-N3)-methyltransferase